MKNHRPFTRTEKKLLDLLVQHRNQVVTLGQISELDPAFENPAYVRVLVYALRKGINGQILTHHGVGYEYRDEMLRL